MKKVWQKVAIGKFATFLTPFQASSTKICLQVKSSHKKITNLINLKITKLNGFITKLEVQFQQKTIL